VILVIDDDTQILDSIRRTLIREGWVVLTASGPAEGLQLYGEHWQGISLVLLDYFLPDLRGDEVWERLRRVNPQARVLWMSATDEYIPSKMLNSGLCGFVMKPATRKELFRRIREVLKFDGSPGPAPEGHSAEPAPEGQSIDPVPERQTTGPAPEGQSAGPAPDGQST
jgi:DNA-binding response OmpR family regulator